LILFQGNRVVIENGNGFVGAIRESPAPDHPGLSRSALPPHEGDSRIAPTKQGHGFYAAIAIAKEYQR